MEDARAAREPGTRLWHPFADMAAVSAVGEMVIDRGEGAYVVDEQGRRYLDASAGLWYCNVGHGREALADAAAAQMRRLASYSAFGDLATRPALDLAERLAATAPLHDARVFLTSGGSDSVDTAVKLVRRYWAELGHPERTVIVTREHAYHGMHLAGTSLAGIEANRAGHGDLDPAVVQVPWDDADALEALLSERDDIAAFFCEPIIGAGGVYAPPGDYLARVRETCRRHDVLFVADEVICGYGRAGAMFASERWALDPDVMLTAKGITSGYIPLGAVIVAGRVAEPFWTPGAVPVMWRHGYTYSAHATACAVALAREARTARARYRMTLRCMWVYDCVTAYLLTRHAWRTRAAQPAQAARVASEPLQGHEGVLTSPASCAHFLNTHASVELGRLWHGTLA